MIQGQKKKVIVFVSPVLLGKYTELAREFGVSRSELCRLTLERGFPATRSWCLKVHESVASDGVQGPVSQVAGASVVPGSSPLAQLEQYAVAVMSQDLDLTAEDFVRMLTAQAVVFGLSAPVSEPIVDALARQFFAGEEPAGTVPDADDVGESGDLGDLDGVHPDVPDLD